MDSGSVGNYYPGGGSASCDPATLDAADVSGDGRVTSLDALMILQIAAKRSGIAKTIGINELMPDPRGTRLYNQDHGVI